MTIVFQEGLEDLSKWDRVDQAAGGIATITDAKMIYGKHMIGTGPPDSTRPQARVAKLFPNKPNLLYARGYFSVEQGDPNGGLSLLSMITGSISSAVIRFINVGGVNQLQLVWQTYAGGPYNQKVFTPAVPLEYGRVYMLELMIKVGTSGEVRAWVDEQLACEVLAVDNSALVGIDEVRFGLVAFLGTGGAIVHVDEAAIGDSYIGPFVPPKPPVGANIWVPVAIGATIGLGLLAAVYLSRRK